MNSQRGLVPTWGPLRMRTLNVVDVYRRAWWVREFLQAMSRPIDLEILVSDRDVLIQEEDRDQGRTACWDASLSILAVNVSNINRHPFS